MSLDRKINKKGMFLTISALLLFTMALLFVSLHNKNKEYNQRLKADRNYLVKYDNFVNFLSDHYADFTIRNVVKKTLINLTHEKNILGTITVDDLNKNLTSAILDGNLGGVQLLEGSDIFPAKMKNVHNLTYLPNLNFSITIKEINLTQTNWSELNLYYEMSYDLNTTGVQFKKSLSGNSKISVIRMSSPDGIIRPSWKENITNPCILKTIDPLYDCNGINGISAMT